MADTLEHGGMVQEISEPFDIADREDEAIAHLAGGMNRLHAVRAAKHALAILSPYEVRAALAYRRSRPNDPYVAGGGRHAGELR